MKDYDKRLTAEELVKQIITNFYKDISAAKDLTRSDRIGILGNYQHSLLWTQDERLLSHPMDKHELIDVLWRVNDANEKLLSSTSLSSNQGHKIAELEPVSIIDNLAKFVSDLIKSIKDLFTDKVVAQDNNKEMVR